MSHCITVLPEKLRIEAENGETPLSVRRTAGLIPGAPCGGEDRCGKNRVFADGADVISGFMGTAGKPNKQHPALSGNTGAWNDEEISPVLCRDNGLSYYYGERTITHTACVLF